MCNFHAIYWTYLVSIEWLQIDVQCSSLVVQNLQTKRFNDSEFIRNLFDIDSIEGVWCAPNCLTIVYVINEEFLSLHLDNRILVGKGDTTDAVHVLEVSTFVHLDFNGHIGSFVVFNNV